ncbi:hypothetical protein F2P81_020157 [Scophthalmus maximus]|uniref:Phospholipid/glycerol acyltransferase domain-containing protein n=1 Tax=Scophthalmus maximus TaxID=52904 RepID=A0A6A4RX84_SCOMX|nr:hypothetical protein F2P81_020157 [Scophthalmus maximus]
MLLSLVVHTHSLRYWFPATVMLGTAPAYLLSWGAWRLLSTVLPARVYHRLDDRLYCVYQSMVLFFFENYTGVEVVIHGDIPKNKENVIYLSNHQCTADWIIADMLAIRQSAIGHVRYVLKDGLKWLPLYGWYFSQHGGIYVKRSAKFNEAAMKKKLLTQTQSGAPMYLVIFPEGTRYNPELTKVIADSQAFATKEGLAVLKHTLTPRMRASHVAIETMRGHLDAVYDVTVAYEGTPAAPGQRRPAPSMPEFLCKECRRVHVHFDRVDIKEIPPEPVFFRRWLHERFEIKDRGADTAIIADGEWQEAVSEDLGVRDAAGLALGECVSLTNGGSGRRGDTHKRHGETVPFSCITNNTSRSANTARLSSDMRIGVGGIFVMAVDWIGFCYAAAIAFGGFMGYKRKGSVMSLMAGLVFGGLSAYGAYNVSNDSKDIKVSLLAAGVLSLVMGTRYKKSGKILPAGIMSGLRSGVRVAQHFADGVSTVAPARGVSCGTTLTEVTPSVFDE